MVSRPPPLLDPVPSVDLIPLVAFSSWFTHIFLTISINIFTSFYQCFVSIVCLSPFLLAHSHSTCPSIQGPPAYPHFIHTSHATSPHTCIILINIHPTCIYHTSTYSFSHTISFFSHTLPRLFFYLLNSFCVVLLPRCNFCLIRSWNLHNVDICILKVRQRVIHVFCNARTQGSYE